MHFQSYIYLNLKSNYAQICFFSCDDFKKRPTQKLSCSDTITNQLSMTALQLHNYQSRICERCFSLVSIVRYNKFSYLCKGFSKDKLKLELECLWQVLVFIGCRWNILLRLSALIQILWILLQVLLCVEILSKLIIYYSSNKRTFSKK